MDSGYAWVGIGYFEFLVCCSFVLSDGTIVSGDSLGMVKFWDSRTATQLQSFQAHGADVLCLTVGPVRFFIF
jgi:U3 small nucleolar RNA-associated protein 4